MIRTVLFDLDDTLYPEREFYLGGFSVVADLLAQRGIGPAERVRQRFFQFHLEDRQGVFDRAATELGFPTAWIPQLVAAFHAHTPQIRLPRPSADLLAQLRRRYRLGIVTDGHAAVQRRKVESLGLVRLVDAIVFSDDLGREYWKPHPLPFHKCCEALASRPEEAVFVGDHPERDVAGAHRAGMRAIRLRSADSYFFQTPTPPREPADREIACLRELPGLLARLESQEAALP